MDLNENLPPKQLITSLFSQKISENKQQQNHVDESLEQYQIEDDGELPDNSQQQQEQLKDQDSQILKRQEQQIQRVNSIPLTSKSINKFYLRNNSNQPLQVEREAQGVDIEKIQIEENNNIIKIQGIDFSDPNNRKILEDQFFGQDQNVLKVQDQQGKQKTFIENKFKYLSLFLAAAGIALIIVGFVTAFGGSETNLMRGGAFWVIGSLCCIPGVYYSYKIISIEIKKKKNTIQDQDQNDIPRV